MYVLDTNTLIYFFKGMGNVSSNVLMKPPGSIAIPAIVLFELEVGIAKSISPKKRRLQLERFTSVVKLLPLGQEEVKCAASIRADLERQGQPIGPYDVLIAGTTLAAGGILVTHNTSEFKRIKGLRIEDWY
jgi:tRNA(fMet)-specific endonuclease VapC